jgi:hypothetical protein
MLEASKAQAGGEEGVVGVETFRVQAREGETIGGARVSVCREAHGGMVVHSRDDAFGGGRAPGRRKPRRGNGLFWMRNSMRAGTDSRHVEPRGQARGSHDDGAARTAAKAPQAGSQRRGGDGFRKGRRRVWRSKPLKGESP